MKVSFLTPAKLLEAAINDKINPLIDTLLEKLVKELPRVIDIQLLKKGEEQNVHLGAIYYPGSARDLRIHSGAINEKITKILKDFEWEVTYCDITMKAVDGKECTISLTLSLKPLKLKDLPSS